MKSSNQILVIVVGSNLFPFWFDRPLAIVINKMLFNGKAAILTDKEYLYQYKLKNLVVISIGGVINNLVSERIANIYPEPLVQLPGNGPARSYIQGGVKRSSNNNEMIDPCLLIAGVKIRDTVRAVYNVLNGDWKNIVQSFATNDWTANTNTNFGQWKKTYWNLNGVGVVAEPSVAQKSSIETQINRIVWNGSLTLAAQKIREAYEQDRDLNNPRYKNLKDATTEFFNTHEFPKYPEITKEKLYESVKQVR